MSVFLLSDLVEKIFRRIEISSFFDQSKRGFKFLLKHDWFKKVNFVINRALNLEHFVNKFHSPSLMYFLLRLLCVVKKIIQQGESLQKSFSFRTLFL